jgi:hypothetical protein
MSDTVFTGSRSYCTKKVRDLQKRGWRIVSFRNIDGPGDKQVYQMTYVGMELRNGRWVSK